jgi:hypothetical protein
MTAGGNRGFALGVYDSGFPRGPAGLPAASNTHEVAQSIAPESRIVYAGNDHCKRGCVHADLGYSDRLEATTRARPVTSPA